MGPWAPRPLRRREFLGGTVAAAAGMAVHGLGSAAPAAARAELATLSASRAATYRRLVVTLTHGPDGRFRHGRPLRATEAFARWYAEQPATLRHHVNAVLDVLRAHGPPPYDDLARPVKACADLATTQRCAAVAAGIELAVMMIGPASPPGERPVVAALAQRP
jgi:hypothetical protein